MDKNSLSVLEDYKSKIEESFKTIDKAIKSIEKADKNKKITILDSIKKELPNTNKNFDLMEIEVNNLISEENKNIWKEIVKKIKHQLKTYNKKIKELEEDSSFILDSKQVEDHLDVNAKVDLKQLNAQQVMDRGDMILKEDDKIIGDVTKTLGDDVRRMKETNKALYEQEEQLDNVNNDLKEMNYSLERARSQITSMFKMYSRDKCITGLIIVILIIIVVIVIVAACGGDNEKNFNVPHDIFNKNTTSSSAGELIYSKKFGINNLVGICLVLMELIY